MNIEPFAARLSPCLDNTLLGLPFNEERYQKTLEVGCTPKARLTASLRIHQRPQDP